MIRSAICFAAAATLGFAVPAAAQDYAASGWRAATAEEKALRSAFEKAQDDWDPKRDGEREQYDCVLHWASWSIAARDETSDAIPAISGELSHSYADAHLSHHTAVLIQAEGGNAEAFGRKLAFAAAELPDRMPDSMKGIVEALGKCYTPPLSWMISNEYRISGPQLLNVLGGEANENAFPIYVQSSDARKQFDVHIMNKDFVAAANFGAQLHGQNDKTSVMWNEVLRASLLSVESGRGLELSVPLLSTLSQVWWPKHRRKWASNLLRRKQGLPTEQASRPPLYDPGEEPGWAKQERERFLAGETNYTPCNRWNTYGC